MTFVDANTNHETEAHLAVKNIGTGTFQVRVTGTNLDTDKNGNTPDRVNYLIINP